MEGAPVCVDGQGVWEDHKRRGYAGKGHLGSHCSKGSEHALARGHNYQGRKFLCLTEKKGKEVSRVQ